MNRAGGPRWDLARRIGLNWSVQPTSVDSRIYGDVGVLIRREEDDERGKFERIDGDVGIVCSTQKYVD
jgi:hypothetical protein